MTNRTFTALLRDMVNKSLKDWNAKLSHDKFAYNRTPSCGTSDSPFKVCYDLSPVTALDLIPISQESKVSFEAEAMAKEMKKLHEQAMAQIENVNEQYKSKANKNRIHLKFK